jgi:membrane-associated PAP2 superfamily phosphatase
LWRPLPEAGDIVRNLIASAMLGVLLAVLGATATVAQPIKIVAFGGSSTYGQGLERYDAYPAKLERRCAPRGTMSPSSTPA